jgi:hypothetical protein
MEIPIMSIANCSINRIYECSNDDCKGKVSFVQKISDPWKKKCPFCRKYSLYLDSATSSMTLIIDNKKPNTMGGISDQNKLRREKDGKEWIDSRGHTPFWRKNKKIDYNILRNPKKFVETGQI